MSKDVIVRAYDLGGYGDIAGALRVAEYFSRVGIDVGIMPVSPGAREKLRVLEPHCPYRVVGDDYSSSILVDVAGHYFDSRVKRMISAPHLFVEDMDNPDNRVAEVPLYLKTGFVQKPVDSQAAILGIQDLPLFYRPYKEDEIPARKNLDPIELIVKQLERSTGFFGSERTDYFAQVYSALSGASRVSFAHFNPAATRWSILTSPFFLHFHRAARNSWEKYVLGLFLGSAKGNEFVAALENSVWFDEIPKAVFDKIARNKLGVNYVSKDYVRIKDKNFPTIVFLGPTPQLETSKMFLSATVPPLVTGDLSLSDALYFLLAKDGPGFFYDCPGWKVPTFDALRQMIVRPVLKNVSLLNPPDDLSVFLMKVVDEVIDGVGDIPRFLEVIDALSVFRQFDSDAFSRDILSKVFTYDFAAQHYAASLKRSLEDEIISRFGRLPKISDGKVPHGSPFLLQDAAADIVQLLLNDVCLRNYFDGLRHEINCQRVYDDEVVAVPQTIKIDDVKEKVMISVRPMFSMDSVLKDFLEVK